MPAEHGGREAVQVVGSLGPKERLRQLLREKALKKGGFKLASGAVSPYYIDARQVTLDAQGIRLTAEVVWASLENDDFDAVGGPTIGSDPMTASVATLGALSGRPVDAFLVRKQRKKHGLAKGIEGPLEAGDRVVLLEDVVTSGNSVMDAAEKVKAIGAEVVKVIALVDRLEGAREALEGQGYDFEAIFTIQDLQG